MIVIGQRRLTYNGKLIELIIMPINLLFPLLIEFLSMCGWYVEARKLKLSLGYTSQ